MESVHDVPYVPLPIIDRNDSMKYLQRFRSPSKPSYTVDNTIIEKEFDIDFNICHVIDFGIQWSSFTFSQFSWVVKLDKKLRLVVYPRLYSTMPDIDWWCRYKVQVIANNAANGGDEKDLTTTNKERNKFKKVLKKDTISLPKKLFISVGSKLTIRLKISIIDCHPMTIPTVTKLKSSIDASNDLLIHWKSDQKTMWLNRNVAKSIAVPKQILCMHSQYFRSLVYGNFKERKQNEIVIREGPVTLEDFEAWIQYIVNGSNLENDWMSILKAADYFMCDGILRSIDKILTERTRELAIDPLGIVDTEKWAERYRLRKTLIDLGIDYKSPMLSSIRAMLRRKAIVIEILD